MQPAEIYSRFTSLPGSQYMASQFAIGQLIRWKKRSCPARVLEIGTGIGTLTFTLASIRQKQPFQQVSMEWDDYCRDQLRANLADQWDDFKLIRTMDDLDEEAPFDFVLYDGGDQDPRPISKLPKRAVVFIEGFMDKKHELIHSIHSGKRDYVMTNFRSGDRREGVFIFLFDPTLVERLWFGVNTFWNRLCSWLKRRGWFFAQT